VSEGNENEKEVDGSPRINVTEFVLAWEGRTYRINADAVLRAFEKSGVGEVMGPHARYYLTVDGDMKPLEDVLRVLVPIPREKITQEMSRLLSQAVGALGFEVLDRHQPHEF